LWEKKLREIEHSQYSPQQFIAELKQMVSEIVLQVLADNNPRRLTDTPAPSNVSQKKSASKGTDQPKTDDAPKQKRIRAGMKCPVCGQGKVIKGRTAYGCSRWKEGCDFRHPFKS